MNKTARYNASALAMSTIRSLSLGEGAGREREISTYEFDPQDTYLLSVPEQREYFEKMGYSLVNPNDEENPYGLVKNAAEYHLTKHEEVPIYEYTAKSDTTV